MVIWAYCNQRQTSQEAREVKQSEIGALYSLTLNDSDMVVSYPQIALINIHVQCI